jgi:hypothetical protein
MGSRMDGGLKAVLESDKKIQMLIHLIFENALSYIVASQSLDFKTQDEIATRAFQSAYEGILHQVVEEGKQEKAFSHSLGELELSYIYAVILQALRTLRKDPGSNPEQSVCSMVLKMLV